MAVGLVVALSAQSPPTVQASFFRDNVDGFRAMPRETHQSRMCFTSLHRTTRSEHVPKSHNELLCVAAASKTHHQRHKRSNLQRHSGCRACGLELFFVDAGFKDWAVVWPWFFRSLYVGRVVWGKRGMGRMGRWLRVWPPLGVSTIHPQRNRHIQVRKVLKSPVFSLERKV